MAKASDNQFPKVTFAESAAPSTPAAGLLYVYAKTDGKLYTKNDAGTEIELGAAGSSGTLGTLGFEDTLGQADQTGITTITDLTGLSVAVTVASGRRVRISGMVQAYGSANTLWAALYIREGSTTLQTATKLLTSSAGAEVIPVEVILLPSAGAHTYKLSLERTVGSGSLSIAQGAAITARMNHILVEDIGT